MSEKGTPKVALDPSSDADLVYAHMEKELPNVEPSGQFPGSSRRRERRSNDKGDVFLVDGHLQPNGKIRPSLIMAYTAQTAFKPVLSSPLSRLFAGESAPDSLHFDLNTGQLIEAWRGSEQLPRSNDTRAAIQGWIASQP